MKKHPHYKSLVKKDTPKGRGPSSKEQLFLNVKTDFEGTFLMAPNTYDHKRDRIGCWSSKTSFPKADSNYNPSKKVCNYVGPEWPKRVPCKFKDKESENFLNAEQLIEKNKVELDLSVHKYGTISLSPYENFSLQDKILRNSIIENSITDTLIGSNKERLEFLRDNWDDILDKIKNGEVDFKTELNYLCNVSDMSYASNLRNRNSDIAAFTNNKMTLRDRVLFKCNGNEKTKKKLRLSNLASPAVLGISLNLSKRHSLLQLIILILIYY